MSTAATPRPDPVLARAGKSLPELSIQRHVFAYMLSGALLLFGIISFDRIGVDRFPDIDFPMISVRTILPGASPDIIDSYFQPDRDHGQQRPGHRAHSFHLGAGRFGGAGAVRAGQGR